VTKRPQNNAAAGDFAFQMMPRLSCSLLSLSFDLIGANAMLPMNLHRASDPLAEKHQYYRNHILFDWSMWNISALPRALFLPYRHPKGLSLEIMYKIAIDPIARVARPLQ
jgi:hypothetical protein